MYSQMHVKKTTYLLAQMLGYLPSDLVAVNCTYLRVGAWTGYSVKGDEYSKVIWPQHAVHDFEC